MMGVPSQKSPICLDAEGGLSIELTTLAAKL